MSPGKFITLSPDISYLLLCKKHLISEWFKTTVMPVSVAQACNPSYSGGREGEDHSSMSEWAKSLQDPISTNERWA
jgi:hypothetical protein